MADETRTSGTEWIYIERAERLLRLFLYNLLRLQSCTRATEATFSPALLASRLSKREWRLDLPYMDWDYEGLFHYFVERSGTIMKSTWSIDRVSLAFYFVKIGHPDAAELIRSIGFSRCYTKRKPPPGGLRTGAKRQKHLPRDLLNTLDSDLRLNCKSPYANFAADLLWAIVNLGVRPCEWQKSFATHLTPTGEVGLIVENAKPGNQRTPGVTRTLYLTDMPFEHIQSLRRVLQEVAKFLDGPHGEEVLARALQTSRGVIAAVAKRRWPKRKKRPNLYSARHQFAANLKLAGFSRAEIAALMGHATDATATHLYARSGKGTPGGFTPRAEVQEVKNIRQVYKLPDLITKKRPVRVSRFVPVFGPSM